MTLLPKLPRAALSELEKELIKNGHSINHQVDMKAYDDFQISGLDLADKQQDWLVDGSVKLTFFCAKPQHSKLMADSQTDRSTHGFKIASFHQLCQLKATVTASRSKSRDWLDLFILERDHNFGVAGWKEAFDQAGLTPMHFEIALKRMCDGHLSDEDEGFSALLPKAPSVAEMQERFRILRGDYEMELAKLRLS